MENRLDLICNAASHLFINKGYARTQMKDIAKEIGLSTGMLYQYFRGKQDILKFILRSAIYPEFMKQEIRLPVQSDLFLYLNGEIMQALDEEEKDLSIHLDCIDHYPFQQMLSDTFDVISRYGVVCLLIEKNPDDLKELANYYQKYRSRFYKQMEKYLQLYVEAGKIRTAKYPQYRVRLIIETLSWWGMHILYDAFEQVTEITEDVRKEVCLDNLLHSYQL